ncbi:MAG: F0F1 ATP synthase subunit epsilon [candidate division KSB1 bacterium]|nr:F0F1 ATP synthase subunit epsilon [candidate division KSB1 bacterium]MDZ7393058.1 F0F1 ATP synthase subunit epsilon [candidate division KSB1 bacterium]MDZ7414063.1 F0F1 ATP synthase subunit epsilon [candidate division KSB1 bacterium]
MPVRVNIITQERVAYSGDVDMVIAPGADGVLGILPHHAPLMTALVPGELRLKRGAEEEIFAIGGGFMEVLPDRVTVLADSAERAEEIDIARAEAARRRAEARLHGRTEEQVDFARAEASLRRAMVRLKVAEAGRRRRRGAATEGGLPPDEGL